MEIIDTAEKLINKIKEIKEISLLPIKERDRYIGECRKELYLRNPNEYSKYDKLRRGEA